MIEGLKPRYNAVLSPIASLCGRMGIHPNVLTILGLVLFIITGCFVALGYWRIGFIIGFCGACLDGLDGLVARQNNLSSAFGAFLDSVCDRLTEIFWIAGIITYYILQNMLSMSIFCLGFGAVTGSLMVSYVKARSEGIGISCNKGFMQRPERLIILAIAQLIGPSAMPYGLGIVCFFGYLTVFQRIINVWKALQKASLPQIKTA